jgi:hypothetical protein
MISNRLATICYRFLTKSAPAWRPGPQAYPEAVGDFGLRRQAERDTAMAWRGAPRTHVNLRPDETSSEPASAPPGAKAPSPLRSAGALHIHNPSTPATSSGCAHVSQAGWRSAVQALSDGQRQLFRVVRFLQEAGVRFFAQTFGGGFDAVAAGVDHLEG